MHSKKLKKIKMEVTDADLKRLKLCHRKVCPDFPLMDFILSYREAADCSEIKGKQLSVELQKVLISYSSWKPLTVAMVILHFY